MLRRRVCADKVKTYGALFDPLGRMNRHMVILTLSTWDEAMALTTGLTNSTRNRQSPGINASCDWLPLESSHTIDFEGEWRRLSTATSENPLLESILILDLSKGSKAARQEHPSG